MDQILQHLIGEDPLIVSNIISMVRMLVAYIFVCIVLPSIFLSGLVKKQNIVYRVIFYQLVSNMYIIMVGFVLVYLNIFGTTSVWIMSVFVPHFIYAIINRRRVRKFWKLIVKKVVDITLRVYGFRKARAEIANFFGKKIQKIHSNCFKGHMLEWMMIGVVLLYILIYLGYFKFHIEGYRYGVADEEVHLYWIQSLFEGNGFPSGLYPHGMHFVVSNLAALFGIMPIEAYLNFAMVLNIVLFLNIYFIIRSIFRFKYAGLFGIAVFVVPHIINMNAMFRYQFALPMEWGLISVFTLFFSLYHYMKNGDKTSWWMFVLSLAWGVNCHFFVTIWAVILCLPFGLVFFIRMIKKRTLHKVIVGGILAAVIAGVPYGIGLLFGHPFEQSIAWALGMMSFEEEYTEQTEEATTAIEESLGITWDNLQQAPSQMENYAYTTSDVGFVMIGLATLTFVYGIIVTLIKRRRLEGLMYVFLSLSWFVTLVGYLAGSLGLPVIVIPSRMATFLVIWSVPIFAVVIQVVSDMFYLIFFRRLEIVRNILLLGVGIGFIAGVLHAGYVNFNRYYDSTISDVDAILTKYLINEKESQKWTIITTTNTLSLVIRDGYHYEIIDLLSNLEEEEEIYIPTPEVYVVVEKNITNESVVFFDQEEKNPEILTISPEYALDDRVDIFDYTEGPRNEIYQYYREIVMSKLYYWAEELMRTYPQNVSVFDETEDHIVYVIEQDEFLLLNLAVDYMATIQGEEANE